MFLEGKSLRKIAEELNLNRKKLSLLLRDEGIKTSKHLSEEQINEVKKLMNDGLNMSMACQRLDLCYDTVSKELEKIGFRSKRRSSTRIKTYDSLIIKKYVDEKKSIYTISIELSVSTNLVWNCLLHHGLNDSDRLYRKYEYNENAFLSIGTEEESYWLGFLMADGYVDKAGCSLEVSLKEEDSYHLEKLLGYLSSSNKLSYRDVNGHPQCRIYIHNKTIVSNLISHGCVNNKSLIKKFPKSIPNELIHHFFRGYFDGNGTICVQPTMKIFSICTASFDFIESFQKKFSKLSNVRKNSIIKSRNLYSFSNASRADIEKIFNYLYSDATIYLERKYQKFLNNI